MSVRDSILDHTLRTGETVVLVKLADRHTEGLVLSRGYSFLLKLNSRGMGRIWLIRYCDHLERIFGQSVSEIRFMIWNRAKNAWGEVLTYTDMGSPMVKWHDFKY